MWRNVQLKDSEACYFQKEEIYKSGKSIYIYGDLEGVNINHIRG